MNPHASPAPLCTLIPAYNAAGTVGDVVRRALAIGPPVLVVDDGSADSTSAAAAAAGAIVLRHAGNRGKGAALQTGFAYALQHGADAVLTLDADGQHDPTEAAKLLAAHAATPGSLVIGVRSFDPTLMPRRSRIGNNISTFFISRFAGRPHRDTQSGFRLYPRRLLSAPLRTRHFDTETELVLWAAKLGVPLCEVPIQTIYSGHASGHASGQAPRRAQPADPAPDAGTGTDPGPPVGHTSHFRNGEDTLRVIRLVVGSPWWRTEAVGSP